MKFIQYLIALTFLSVNVLSAEQQIHLNNVMDSETPRFHSITKMYPESWNIIPYVSPHLPNGYIIDFNDGINLLWGRKTDIESFNKNSESKLSAPIFCVRYSSGVSQTGSVNFSQTDREITNEFKNIGVKDLKIDNIKWGSYPVKAIQYTIPKINKKIKCMWVGLNHDGLVMMIMLFASGDEKKDDQIWKNFLSQTKELSEEEIILASGSDLREGYTFYKSGSAILKIVAEKKSSNGKLSIMISPLTENVTFDLKNVQEVYMGSKWKYGTPCTKISGIITQTLGKSKNISNCTITVLTKYVDDYSFNLDQSKHPSNVLIHQ